MAIVYIIHKSILGLMTSFQTALFVCRMDRISITSCSQMTITLIKLLHKKENSGNLALLSSTCKYEIEEK